MYDRSKTSDPVTSKLIKDLKNLDPAVNQGSKKVGKLESSIFQHFSVDKNPEMLMEKAARVPRSNEELQVTE